MSASQLPHLIKMLNQIALNNTYKDNYEQAAAKVASHVQRFWAPSMKAEIIRYANADGAELSEIARLALGKMKV
ncbi:MAG: formate dehydrogenase [Proteobacteria bacterium]|nr:MAG: formate dehydrogenase [Pseudomonadota bacterium]